MILNRRKFLTEKVTCAARSAHAAGIEAVDAGSNFSVPRSLGDWALFNPPSNIFYTRAFEAWYGELKS
jgi:hypothetical protein